MKTDLFKKLSPIQQQVVNALMFGGRYVVKSTYYNHNKVNSREPMEHDGYKYHCVMQFQRPTFEVLERRGIIIQSPTEHKDIYIFNPELL